MDAIERIVGSSKLEKAKVQHNLVGARSLEGLGKLCRLGLEGFLLFLYPNFIISGLLTTWRVAERFYAENFSFLFDNTLLCCLCVCIFLPLIFAI